MTDDLVMGRFRVLERIGSGGMGTVYRAFDERLQRHVAVKEIEHAGAQRVLREAQAAARLNHPAIVTLYELGERDGHALLVSELVEGATLDVRARRGELSDRDVAEIGSDLCEALEHAHARGVVHRDVKPQNAMVRPFDASGRRAKLMDFGIAAVAGAPALTATGEVVGTLAYMAPEQAEGADAGPAADTYALALSLYEAWAGYNPVAGRSPAQTARRIGRPVPSLAEARPDLPTALVANLGACLEADPDERPSAAQLRNALEHAIPALDDEAAVPAPDGAELGVIPARSPLRVAAMVGAGVAVATLAGPAGLPGLALALALVALPGLVFCTNPVLAALPLAAIPLAAVGALAAAPALIAVCAHRARERAVLGATSFAAYLFGALALDAGPRLGIAPAAPGGWAGSLADTTSGLVGPLLEPAALLGVAVLALAALVLGVVLRAHPALAVVGAMLWAAGMAAALSMLGNGAQGRSAAMAVLAGGLAVAIEARRRSREQRRPGAPAPVPELLASVRPALHGG